MKLLYIFLFFILVHCSSSIEFSVPAEPVDGGGLLYSENEDDMSQDVSDESEEKVNECETFDFESQTTPLDILFVLDVSQSMRHNLTKLGQSMSSLLTYIEDFDWQIAFTTADHGDHFRVGGKVGEQKWQDYKGDLPHFGQLMNLEYRKGLIDSQFLTKNTHFYERVFYDTLTLNSSKPQKDCNSGLPPYCQGGHEQPLRSLKAALERDENRGFFREGSDLIAIIVTNEDERVEDPENATTAEEVKSTFESIFPSDKNLYGFGIIVNDKECHKLQNRKSTRSVYSTRVSEFAKVNYGRNISICNSNYGPALRGVSKLIKDRVSDNIQLKNHPVGQSVRVSLSTNQDVNWQVQGRHVLFDSAIEEGTQVQICYNF